MTSEMMPEGVAAMVSLPFAADEASTVRRSALLMQWGCRAEEEGALALSALQQGLAGLAPETDAPEVAAEAVGHIRRLLDSASPEESGDGAPLLAAAEQSPALQFVAWYFALRAALGDPAATAISSDAFAAVATDFAAAAWGVECPPGLADELGGGDGGGVAIGNLVAWAMRAALHNKPGDVAHPPPPEEKEEEREEEEEQAVEEEVDQPPPREEKQEVEDGEKAPPQDAEAEVSAGGGGGVTDDVVGEFGSHAFSLADERDVVRVQSLVRRHAAQRRSHARREEVEAQRRAAQAVNIEPITMPPPPPPPPPATVAAPAASATAADGARGRFAAVDLGRIEIAPMSADTRGMQGIYTRMLKSKTWW